MPCRHFGFTRLVELILCLLVLNAGVQAQTTGEINGTVTDPAGAVVPGATITVTNPNTNIERTTQTNSSGVYSISALPPGEYSLRA